MEVVHDVWLRFEVDVPDASGSYPTEFDMENAVKLRRIDENLNIVQ